MKLIPAALRNLAALPWQGAVTADTYQRLVLRYYLAGLQALFIYAVVVLVPFLALFLLAALKVPVWAIIPALAVNIVNMALFTVVGVFLIWYGVMNLKLKVLRLRNLGFSTGAVIGLVAILMLASVVMGLTDYLLANPIMMAMGYLPYKLIPVLPYISLLSFLGALCAYWQYFETTPLRTPTTPITQPIASIPGRFESFMLLVLQTTVWFGIFYTPIPILFL